MPEFTPEQIQELQTMMTAAMAAALPQAPPRQFPKPIWRQRRRLRWLR